MIYFPIDPFGGRQDLFEKAILNNHYLISRYDGILIDGKAWHFKVCVLKNKYNFVVHSLSRPWTARNG